VNDLKAEKVQRYFEVMQEWREATRYIGTGFLVMGRCLSILKKEQLWRLDNQTLTFRLWVEGELKICYSQAMRLIQVYEEAGRYIENTELQGIDIYKVVLLLPYFDGKTDEEKIELLHMAKECKVTDIKNNLREMKGLTPTDKCEHKVVETWQRCLDCGKFFK
jgi:hypothetical protein